jgi:hypothetical protein
MQQQRIFAFSRQLGQFENFALKAVRETGGEK